MVVGGIGEAGARGDDGEDEGPGGGEEEDRRGGAGDEAGRRAEAVEEADYVLGKLRGKTIDAPVVFDWETAGSANDVILISNWA